LSDHNSGGGVYVQDTNCDFSSTGLSNENPGPPLKVTTPNLSARMEQRNDLAFNKSGQIGSLRGIALRARQAKVLGIIAPAVLARNNVLNVEGVEVEVVLVNLAILATASGATPH
jgi:hypothetical protein